MAIPGDWLPGVLKSWRGRAVIVATVIGVALASAMPATAAGTAAQVAAPRVVATILLGNGPSVPMVNPRNGTAYVLKNDTVLVISGRANKVTATIPIREGKGLVADGVSVSAVTGDVYVFSGHPANALAGGTVAVISGRTDKIITTIPLGYYLGHFAISPVTGDLYFATSKTSFPAGNGSWAGDTVLVISGRTNKITATIPVPGAWGMAASPQTGEVYVISGYNLSVISGRTDKITATIQIDPPQPNPTDGWDPVVVAVSPVTGKVYVVSQGFRDGIAETVLDGRTNKIIATIPPTCVNCFSSSDAQIVFSPRTGAAYIADQISDTPATSNFIQVISGQTNRVSTIRLPPDGGSVFAIDPRTGDLYVPALASRTSGSNTYEAVVGVLVIDGQAGNTIATIQLPHAVGGALLTVSTATGELYLVAPANPNAGSPNTPYSLSVISG
jgi:DNA-binding beta-propeller fold protein YncE